MRCRVRSWHLSDIPAALAFVRYWTKASERDVTAFMSAIDLLLPPSLCAVAPTIWPTCNITQSSRHRQVGISDARRGCGGQVVIRRQLKRRYVLAFFQKLPSCLVGIEACASSHHWSRELMALGHTVRLMPPAYVKPYVKRQRTTLRTRRPSARLSPGPTCGSLRPRPPSSRAAWYFIGRAISSSASTAVIMRSGPILPSSGSSLRSDAWCWATHVVTDPSDSEFLR